MIRLPKWLMALLGIAILLALTSPALALEAKGKIKKISAEFKKFSQMVNKPKREVKLVEIDKR